MTDSATQKIKGGVISRGFSSLPRVSPLLAASPFALFLVVTAAFAAALLVFLLPATPLLVVIPIGLVLGAVIFISQQARLSRQTAGLQQKIVEAEVLQEFSQ